MRKFDFEQLQHAPLIVDAIYEGGNFKNVKDDPLARILPVGNQGGFRYRLDKKTKKPLVCVLYSDFVSPDWPDRIDEELGLFTYYGDNRTPGHELHDTRRKGNLLLSKFFDAAHSGNRSEIPPIFVFAWAAEKRNVVFKGLAVPGADGMGESEDLVAVWKSRHGGRFQNYRATFTLLDVAELSREWINAVLDGNSLSDSAPTVWRQWQESGKYEPLRSARSIVHRRPAEQLPTRAKELGILHEINKFYGAHPSGKYAFETCAAELVRLELANTTEILLTRPWRDGGRDALGKFRIGGEQGGISVDFAMEAKCKKPSPRNSCGVKDVSRLVSRLRHRQFGVFVTTSCIGEQAYKEIVEDGHPIVVISGIDICRILKNRGVATVHQARRWLTTNFSPPTADRD